MEHLTKAEAEELAEDIQASELAEVDYVTQAGNGDWGVLVYSPLQQQEYTFYSRTEWRQWVEKLPNWYSSMDAID